METRNAMQTENQQQEHTEIKTKTDGGNKLTQSKLTAN